MRENSNSDRIELYCKPADVGLALLAVDDGVEAIFYTDISEFDTEGRALDGHNVVKVEWKALIRLLRCAPPKIRQRIARDLLDD